MTVSDNKDFTCVWHREMRAFDAFEWQSLAAAHPFLNISLLQAFESSGAVGGNTGWYPHHLAVYRQQQLVAALPLYLKTHSYGEYVFDWAWAEAYESAGGQYYPKLISAIPFSPVTGPRILVREDCVHEADLVARMLDAVQTLCVQHGLSGVHMLFPDQQSASWCAAHGWLRREGVQFRWENHAYTDWAQFLATLSHDKRKKIRQERKKVAQQGVVCRVLDGHQATEDDWDLFYRCYCNTYAMHNSQPYLNAAFFKALVQTMPDHLALFVATHEEQDVAASLCVHGGGTLYGRYWGALKDLSCLHFELCYYLPQQFCITHGIQYFEGGAQGVHKLARGFVPYTTCSTHWLENADFQASVARFLRREAGNMQAYVTELEERSPYKATGAAQHMT